MENTAKNFALQLGSLVSLYVSIGALIALLFGVITVKYPDVAQNYYDVSAGSSGIRFGIALLIVFFPAYVVLTRLVNNVRRREQGTYLTLTKWLIYLSLLVGGATLLGDLVTVLNSFLNGELTIRFVLKALTFLVVVGAAFIYYLFDARGYWQTHEIRSIQYGSVVGVVVVVSLIVGFLNIESPAQVREQNIDQKQISDLQLIQSQVENYYVSHEKLPASISDMFSGITAPVASSDRSVYEYTATSDTTFKLCAEFAFATSKTEQLQYAQPVFYDGAVIKNANDWNHSAGVWCFERVLGVGAGTGTPPIKR